jgi:hypothetical protein
MTPTSSAAEFFLRTLPTAIAQEPARFAALTGRLSFKCGDDAYVVDLGNVAAPVVVGFDKGADVRLWFFGDAFDRFLAGVPVVGKKDRIVLGDVTVLERFGRFLRPAPVQSSLSVRFASASL